MAPDEICGNIEAKVYEIPLTTQLSCMLVKYHVSTTFSLYIHSGSDYYDTKPKKCMFVDFLRLYDFCEKMIKGRTR